MTNAKERGGFGAKGLLALIIAFSLMFSCVEVSAVSVTGRGGIVIDYATGYVLYEKNADTPFVPASMTKIMTLYVLFSEMEARDLDFDSEVTVSARAARMSVDPELSNVPLNEGQSYTVQRLVSAVCTVSACAATLALAEAVAGSEADFVSLMNDYAGRLGLTAYYEDCYGLNGENRITPRSMAMLARRMIMDYPQILQYSSISSLSWDGKTKDATNELLPGLKHEYAGTDGLKTGYTNSAGYCLTATAVRGGRRLISVLFGCKNSGQRFVDSAAMLDQGFEDVGGKVAELYATECQIDAPEVITEGEEATVSAEIGNVVTPSIQWGEWLINGVPAGEPGAAWLDKGNHSYLSLKLEDYTADTVNIGFRLFNPTDSLLFEKTVAVNHRSLAVTKAWADVVFDGSPVDNDVKYPYIAYNGVTYMPLTTGNCALMGWFGGWTPEEGMVLRRGAAQSPSDEIGGDCGPLRAEALDGGSVTLDGAAPSIVEEYPMISCNGVIYFPLTAETAAAFGLGIFYDYDGETLYITRVK